MAGLIGGWGAIGLGATLPAEGFRTTGQGSAGWYWLYPQCQAEWEFHSLPPGVESHVVVEAFVCLSLPNGSAPAEIEVRFQVTTAAPIGRLWVARLCRIQSTAGHALYFGQLFLSRRELGLGSRLTVRLDGAQAGIPMGVHPNSVRISLGPGGTPAPVPVAAAPDGRGGGWEEVAAATTGSAGAAAPVRALPDSASAASAPFLAPGTYRGTLGWAGPYTEPIGKGVYKVHLRVGQIVTVRIETTSPCTLCLLDPAGRKVGEVTGGSWLGLEYRAHTDGAWQILITCQDGRPRFPYTLTLGIR